MGVSTLIRRLPRAPERRTDRAWCRSVHGLWNRGAGPRGDPPLRERGPDAMTSAAAPARGPVASCPIVPPRTAARHTARGYLPQLTTNLPRLGTSDGAKQRIPIWRSFPVRGRLPTWQVEVEPIELTTAAPPAGMPTKRTVT